MLRALFFAVFFILLYNNFSEASSQEDENTSISADVISNASGKLGYKSGKQAESFSDGNETLEIKKNDR